MAINGPSQSDHDEDPSVFAEINITPLTDVFLVLLIIFMVTSTVITNSGVKVNLPKMGAASTGKADKGVTVTLDANGKIYINKKEVSDSTLEAELRSQLSATSNKSVILAGDKNTYLGKALTVMNTAKRAGAEKFAIATEDQQKLN